MVAFHNRTHHFFFFTTYFKVKELKLNPHLHRPQLVAFSICTCSTGGEVLAKKNLHDCWKWFLSSEHTDPAVAVVVDTASICSPLYLFSGLFSVIACVHLLLHSCMAAHFPGNSLQQTYGSLHFK